MKDVTNVILMGLFTVCFVFLVLLIISPVKEEPKEIYKIDGCSVYRFQDGGSKHYFTNCRN